MDRVVLNPIFFYLLFCILLSYFYSGWQNSWLYSVFACLILVEIIAEFGQIFHNANCPRIACVLLQISTVFRQPWLWLPGKYPIRVYIASTNQLSGVLCDLQKYSQALAVNSRNVELLRQRMPNSQDLAGEIINQSSIYSKMGEAQKAEIVANEALEIIDSVGTADDTSLILNNLGVIYMEMKSIDKAMEAFDRSLQIRKAIKVDDVKLAYSNGNIGYSLVVAGKYSEAEPYLRKAIELSGRASGELKATFRNNLGESLRGQRNLVEAEVMLNDALKIRKKSLSKNHPHLGYSYHNLAKLLVDKGEFEAAEKNFKLAIEIRTKHPGAKFKDFNETGEEYCKMLIKLNRIDEAQAFSSVHKLSKID